MLRRKTKALAAFRSTSRPRRAQLPFVDSELVLDFGRHHDGVVVPLNCFTAAFNSAFRPPVYLGRVSMKTLVSTKTLQFDPTN